MDEEKLLRTLSAMHAGVQRTANEVLAVRVLLQQLTATVLMLDANPRAAVHAFTTSVLDNVSRFHLGDDEAVSLEMRQQVRDVLTLWLGDVERAVTGESP